MNVITYIRVSTDGQCGDDKYGLEAQRADIQKYCAEHGMTIIREYRDEGESGAYERPGFDEIVYGDVTNPPCEAVVVAASDRVGRDMNVYFYYKMLLMKKNMNLISVKEDFGQMGIFAPLLEAFVIFTASMERENITKRTSGGRKIKASKGGYSGGQAPMGYRVEDGKLVIVEREAEIVRLIFKWRDEGASLMAIVDELNDAGYLTRGGKKFVISTVQSIVRNRKTYEGMYHYGKNGEWVRGQHEPILTD